MKPSFSSARGGVALEYLMVTVFASVFAVATLTTTSHWMKSKLESELAKIGVEIPEGSLDIFGGGSSP